MITGKTLMEWGYAPGPWFKEAIAAANASDDPRAVVAAMAPKKPDPVAMRPHDTLAYRMNIRAEEPHEAANVAAVEATMRELMRVPTVVAGAVMPDACPAGPVGTIPVGGIIAAKDAVHPGMHSADICCSVAITVLGDVDPIKVLDAGMERSHFGGGGRPRGQQIRPPQEILDAFAGNQFLMRETSAAIEHFATQGDGNHFFYVGRLKSTGEVAVVTHHGSRKPGAALYKAGMAVAERVRKDLSPETPSGNSWIPSETAEGEAYWQALQIVRDWTKASHFAIHDLVAEAVGARAKDRFWNEHNFVFRKSDGLFYHAKGATPAWADFAADSSGLTLIPLNMAEPILITRGANADHGLGFAPHGAGRNMSRTAFFRGNAGRTPAEMIAADAPGIDVRYFSGVPDISELPSAYKNAASVRRQIGEFGLAEVVDEVLPVGNIMAGDWMVNAPWRKGKKSPPAVEAD
ncbi:MAG: RtcB family protein [Bauldia sp.]|nr:RtcB family protein [Bauldia sp.]